MNNLKIPLQNVANIGSYIYLFCREKDGSLNIIKDQSFLPYYFQEDTNGSYKGYDETKLNRIDCRIPSDVTKQRNNESWESDILYTKRYILDKIESIEKSNPRIMFLDIEVQANELPRPRETKTSPYPISTIVIYDNYTKKYKTFFIKDYSSEFEMLEDFCKTVHSIQPDLWLSWNSDFDMYYLFYRYPDLASKISPINKTRWRRDIEAPAGISIVDMLGLYYKYTLGKKDSYALMNVANDELKYEIEEDFDFENIEIAKNKCQLDVRKMVELNEKLNLINYYDEIRLLTHTLWEDQAAERTGYGWQSNNSKIIDMLALMEAKKLNVILPSKYMNSEETESIEGAYREVLETGLFSDLAKVDISGAYPQAIIDFCLSPENFIDEPEENTIKIDVISRETKEHKATYYVKQNSNAVLPSLVRKLLKMKNELKEKMNQEEKGSEEYKKLEIAYASRKSLVNSAFGVIAMRYFRLFNFKTGDTITFLIRDLLNFIKQKLEKENKIVRYFDTDSAFLDGKEDITEQLNLWALEWGMDKYNNEKVDITFDYEGFFSSIFIPAMCRYRGRLETSKGQKIETKGLQMKRRDSCEWVKKWQEELIDKILDKESKENIILFIEKSIKKMQEADLLSISVPCKMNKPRKEYKKKEIYFEAIDETQKLVSEFNKTVGDRFYWIYMTEPRVMALGKKYNSHIDRNKIDWQKMIERNILNILVPIFKGLNWEEDLLKIAEEYKIILGSQNRKDLLSDLENYEELKDYYSAREIKKRIFPKENKVKIKKEKKSKSLKTRKIEEKKIIKKVDNNTKSMIQLDKEIDWD